MLEPYTHLCFGQRYIRAEECMTATRCPQRTCSSVAVTVHKSPEDLPQGKERPCTNIRTNLAVGQSACHIHPLQQHGSSRTTGDKTPHHRQQTKQHAGTWKLMNTVATVCCVIHRITCHAWLPVLHTSALHSSSMSHVTCTTGDTLTYILTAVLVHRSCWLLPRPHNTMANSGRARQELLCHHMHTPHLTATAA
jgi:hypothetical protein